MMRKNLEDEEEEEEIIYKANTSLTSGCNRFFSQLEFSSVKLIFQEDTPPVSKQLISLPT